MSGKCSKHVPCSVKGQTQIPLNDADAPAIVRETARVKIPVVLAERIVQIVVEANIELEDGAVEIN